MQRIDCAAIRAKNCVCPSLSRFHLTGRGITAMVKPKIAWMSDCDNEIGVCQISFSCARAREREKEHTGIKRCGHEEESVIVAWRLSSLRLRLGRQRRPDFTPESFSRNGELSLGSRFSTCSLQWHNELLFLLKMTPPCFAQGINRGSGADQATL